MWDQGGFCSTLVGEDKDRRRTVCNLARRHVERLLVLGHETLPTRPAVFPRLLICCGAIGILTRAHETVSSTLISHGVVGFSESFHARSRLRDGSINAFIIAGIKAENGSCDVRHCLFIGRRTVKNECSG